MVEQMLSWHALDLHTELSPRRTFFMEVRKEIFAVMAYYHYTLLTGVIQGLFRASDKIS